MASSKLLSEAPLSTLYLHIPEAKSPEAMLGVDFNATEADIRDAYHSLALRIHPDKAPDDSLRELHTVLFQGINTAFEQLLKGHAGHDAQGEVVAAKQLPETWESLHYRNETFKLKLRQARANALQTKNDIKDANQFKKDKREERRTGTQIATKVQHERAQERAERAARAEHANVKAYREQLSKAAPRAEVEDWEEEEDRLEQEEAHAESARVRFQEERARLEEARLLEEDSVKPDPMLYTSAKTRRGLPGEFNGDDDRQFRWHKNLTSGGRSGTVSLAEHARQEKFAHRRTQEKLLGFDTGELDTLTEG